MDSREYAMNQRRKAKAAAEKASKTAIEPPVVAAPAIVPAATPGTALAPVVSPPAITLSEVDRCARRNAAIATALRVEKDLRRSAIISRTVAGKILRGPDNAANAASFFAWRRGAWARSMQYYYQLHGRPRVYRPFDSAVCPECGRP